MNHLPDTDTIIDEIHCTRRQIAEKFGHDLAAILEDARKRQADSDRPEWHGKSSEKTTQRSADDAVVPSGKATSSLG